VAGVVMAISFVLELLHRLLARITGGNDDIRISPVVAARLPANQIPRLSPASIRPRSWVTTNSELRRDGRPYANQRISDTGVAVYFTRKGHEQAVACDKWDSIRDNLQAVAKTIEALRGIDRWGTGEMVDAAFQGFTAIPASANLGIQVRPKRPWHEVLGVSPDAPREVVEAAGKAMLRKTHPDAGGTDAEFQEAQEAIRNAIQDI
jgi:hypothetical protein